MSVGHSPKKYNTRAMSAKDKNVDEYENLASGGMNLKEVLDGPPEDNSGVINNQIDMDEVKQLVNTSVADAVSLSLEQLKNELASMLKSHISNVQTAEKFDKVVSDRRSSMDIQKKTDSKESKNYQRDDKWDFPRPSAMEKFEIGMEKKAPKPRYSFQFKGSSQNHPQTNAHQDGQSGQNSNQFRYSPGLNNPQANQVFEGRPSNTSTAYEEIKTMKMWGIKFYGERDSMPVGDFLFRIEALRLKHGIEQSTLVENFHIFVGGKADAFYWQMYRMRYSRGGNLTWEGIQKEFTSQFQPNVNDLATMRELMNIKQGKDEKFDSLYSRFFRTHDQLDIPLNDDSIVELLRNALREDLDQLTFAAEIKSIDQLRSLVQRAETHVRPSRGSSFQSGRRISELDKDEEYISRERVQYTDNELSGQSKFKCWNCQELGHGYTSCDKERNLFCYKCGKKGVTVYKCTWCQPGNRKTNGGQTEQHQVQTTRQRETKSNVHQDDR